MGLFATSLCQLSSLLQEMCIHVTSASSDRKSLFVIGPVRSAQYGGCVGTSFIAPQIQTEKEMQNGSNENNKLLSLIFQS